MFFFVFIMLCGGGYLLWRFRQISNKQLFYRSSMFRSVAGCVIILVIAIFLVNQFAPARTYNLPEAEIELVDTLSGAILNTHPESHYLFIEQNTKKKYTPAFFILQDYYAECIRRDSMSLIPLAYFGLGVMDLKQEHYENALSKLLKVGDNKMPFLNYSLGEAYEHTKDTVKAKTYFLRELDVDHGNHSESVEHLLEIYYHQHSWQEIVNLFKHEHAAPYFPDHFARTAVLSQGNILAYFYWICLSIINEITPVGFIAALVISLVWIIYLYTLDVFGEQRLLPIVVMFFCGVLSMFIIYLFIDLRIMNSMWGKSGNFFADMLYFIVLVGMPEEFTKLFPILIMLVLIRKPVQPISYIIFAAASALGFAFIENLSYFADESNRTIHGRAYLSAMGHMVFTSFAVYGLALYHFKKKRSYSLAVYLIVGFITASVFHGLFDLLLTYHLSLFFALFFIFMVQVWIIAVNNCLNNSPTFDYYAIGRMEKTRLFLPLSLIAIFAIEYIDFGFSHGSEYANRNLYSNIAVVTSIIIFFSSNLSSFNLIKGYWRDVYFSSKEKRGYGTLTPRSGLVKMYFLNSIQPQNYVGMRVMLFNDAYNRVLAPFIPQGCTGKIVNRVILFENKDQDPHWFILKLDQPLAIPGMHPHYFLVKLRYESESLLYMGDVDVFFRGIPDVETLKKGGRQKSAFPFYGWANLTLIIDEYSAVN